MTHEAYRPRTFEDHISRIIEECAEVIQCCTKIQRFGAGSHHPKDPDKIRNLTILKTELVDLRDAISDFGAWVDANPDHPLLRHIRAR